jgi:hypothetical protein
VRARALKQARAAAARQGEDFARASLAEVREKIRAGDDLDFEDDDPRTVARESLRCLWGQDALAELAWDEAECQFVPAGAVAPENAVAADFDEIVREEFLAAHDLTLGAAAAIEDDVERTVREALETVGREIAAGWLAAEIPERPVALDYDLSAQGDRDAIERAVREAMDGWEMDGLSAWPCEEAEYAIAQRAYREAVLAARG